MNECGIMVVVTCYWVCSDVGLCCPLIYGALGTHRPVRDPTWPARLCANIPAQALVGGWCLS